jgi:hypothetical protein
MSWMMMDRRPFYLAGVAALVLAIPASGAWTTEPNDTKVRVVVSLSQRTLAALRGRDTVFTAPVGVASGLRLSYAGRSWKFQTPKGGRRVLRKVSDPVWTPPDWHYAEVARDHGLRLATIPKGGVKLKGGRRLVVRRSFVGLVMPNGRFARLPVNEHVVFGERLYIPPVGSENRRIFGELGRYALDLGGGYMIHGTADTTTSIDQQTTHGCIRVADADLDWLVANVPVGTRVEIR